MLRDGIKLALKSLGAVEKGVTVVYPEGIRTEIDLYIPKSEMPKKFSFAWIAAEAWALGKHSPEEIAICIEEQFKVYVKTASK